MHPSLLDAKGLVALWREALLAQKVLQGNKKCNVINNCILVTALKSFPLYL